MRIEFPIMLLVAYTAPAFAWLGTFFGKQIAKKVFASVYLGCHLLVELYALIVPILRLGKYWKDKTVTVPTHPLFHNQGHTLGHISVKFYLIISSVVCLLLIIWTVYVTRFIRSYEQQFVVAEMTKTERERLLAQDRPTIKQKQPRVSSKPKIGDLNSQNMPNSMY